MKIGDTVLTFKREPLAKRPHDISYDCQRDRRLDYGRGVTAGLILNSDGTAIAYRQINDARTEVPAPDQPTAVTILLVIHHEIKVTLQNMGLHFDAAEAELRELFLGYGPRLRTYSEPPAPEASVLTGYRGQLLKPAK